ncbi:hypothetical protein DS745_24040 [Anaerobacillus alkaliphilus]|uniref:GK1464-like domain-containing protein n=1 Tax=Anaerobacillus alkaliphilus TaxID=1548597 RepID=A0A4Q0VLY3_9BACI|nr:DUF5634 family protein [Anaerobacillus alkaliphilus]RXI95527.1 hypothetical protein DS745_24040 [Anaerobacillus alkaliphilus]
MEYFQRETIINEMNDSLQGMLAKYGLDDVGIFEEEGEGKTYYLGYTVRKNGVVYMIHQAFTKNEEGQLAPAESSWVIESEAGDTRGYQNLDEVFNYLEEDRIKH